MVKGCTWLAGMVLAAGCARPEIGPVAAPANRAPEIKIGVVPRAASVSLGGGGVLLLTAPDGGGLTEIAFGSTAEVSPGPQGLRVRLGDGTVVSPGPAITVTAADSGGPVRVNGRDYRGAFVLSGGSAGVMAVNALDLEEYLVGVVGAEMGRRAESDLAALRAQAVVSRTVALKALGRSRVRGYDLLSTVADQAYAGTGFETPTAAQAVQETRGEVLTYQGQVIDAFFHSTCGGRTADGVEVFVGADRPYLRSIRDQDESGRVWCAISPRFRWQESWTSEALARTLHETLPPVGGAAGLAGALQDFRILERTPTGRVGRLEIVGRGSSFTVSGPVARLVLRTGDGSILRSANFNLQVTRTGTRIVSLVAEGSGAGHGVGMCQWGALGRARAGFSYQDILSAYFPGTAITRTY